MKKLLLATAVVATVLASPVSARATEVFTLEGVTLGLPGDTIGTLTGTFDCTKCDGTDYSAINITDSLDAVTLTIFNGGSSTQLQALPNLTMFPSATFDFLNLVFESPLPTGGGTDDINTDDISYVLCCTTSSGGGSQVYVTAGYVTTTPSATPLPGAFPLFAGGLGLLGLFSGRSKRKVCAAFAA